MFAGGRLAGAPGLGAAIGEHVSTLGARGAVAWPRPETARFYQDKLALRDLFERTGVRAPRSWVVGSVEDWRVQALGGTVAQR